MQESKQGCVGTVETVLEHVEYDTGTMILGCSHLVSVNGE